MSTRPAPLRATAERRAQDAASPVAPTYQVRGTVRKTMGKGDAQRTSEATPVRPPGAGLTERERRVKDILLQELKAVNGRELGVGASTGSLSYNEIQKLEKTLDVDFIDAELAKMDARTQLGKRVALWLGVPMAVFAVATVAFQLATGQPFDAVFPFLYLPLLAFSGLAQSRAQKRKRWIYQALRELSDAGDEGVQLSESLIRADLLIDRLVDEDRAARRAPLRRIRS